MRDFKIEEIYMIPGKTYPLSKVGLEWLEQAQCFCLTNLRLTKETRVAIVGEKGECSCGSTNDKHTTDCDAINFLVRLPCGSNLYLSKEHVVIPESEMA